MLLMKFNLTESNIIRKLHLEVQLSHLRLQHFLLLLKVSYCAMSAICHLFLEPLVSFWK